ncbi:MAG: hypothetical protein J4F30_09980 [Acidobacteria bacterium]|nr:hypothetical protein [Acidobacteriota bacterium]
MTPQRAVLALAAGVVALAPAGLAEQTDVPGRTAWGDPDLQGVWDFRTITPMERPLELADKQLLTAEEAASYEARENRRQNRDLVDPEKGGAIYPPASEGGVVPYNEFWYDRGSSLPSSSIRRTGGFRRSSRVRPGRGARSAPTSPANVPFGSAAAGSGRTDRKTGRSASAACWDSTPGRR